MRKILFDINVLLDVLLDRKPHVIASARIWAAAETGAVQGVLSAHALTTIHYLVSRERGSATAGRTVAAILSVMDVAKVDAEVIRAALALSWPDFEDAVTAAAAAAAGCSFIVTRDLPGFTHSPVEAITPETAAALLSNGQP